MSIKILESEKLLTIKRLESEVMQLEKLALLVANGSIEIAVHILQVLLRGKNCQRNALMAEVKNIGVLI